MIFEPFMGLFAGVFGVIVLLIYDVLRFAIMGKAFLKFIQNLNEKVSILHAYPGPLQSMQPYSITDPLPNFTVPSTSLSISPSPALFQAHFLLSDHTTHFQSSRVQSLCLIAKSILSFLCFCDRRGFFFFTTAFILVLLRCLCTVWGMTGWLVIG